MDAQTRKAENDRKLQQAREKRKKWEDSFPQNLYFYVNTSHNASGIGVTHHYDEYAFEEFIGDRAKYRLIAKISKEPSQTIMVSQTKAISHGHKKTPRFYAIKYVQAQ